MKTASMAEIRADLAGFLKASEKAPVVITRKGRPVAVIVGIQDENELERLQMASSSRLAEIIEKSRAQIRAGNFFTHDEFWAEIRARRGSKSQAKKASRHSSRP